METEYFWLRMEDPFPMGIELPPFGKEERNGKEPVISFVTTKRSVADTVFQDYLTTYVLSKQAHLISNSLKKLAELYLPKKEWVPAVLIDPEEQQHLYWFCTPTERECLSEKTVYDIGRAVVTPVLKQSKIGNESLFCVKTEKQTLIFLKLDFVESILRREFYGLDLIRVAVEE